MALAVLIAVAAYLVVDDRGSADTLPSTARSTGSAVPLSALAGEWSGEGSLTDCAGFADENCPATRSVTLTIDCVDQPCVVTPFDRSYGRPPLSVRPRYRRRSSEVEPVEIHDLVPRGHEVPHEPRLPVAGPVHL